MTFNLSTSFFQVRLFFALMLRMNTRLPTAVAVTSVCGLICLCTRSTDVSKASTKCPLLPAKRFWAQRLPLLVNTVATVQCCYHCHSSHFDIVAHIPGFTCWCQHPIKLQTNCRFTNHYACRLEIQSAQNYCGQSNRVHSPFVVLQPSLLSHMLCQHILLI